MEAVPTPAPVLPVLQKTRTQPRSADYPAPHLVVTRAWWLAEPSAVSIQDAPRRTRMSWSAAWYCDAVHSHTLPMRS